MNGPRCPVCEGQAIVLAVAKGLSTGSSDGLTYLGVVIGSMLCHNEIPTSDLCTLHCTGLEAFLVGMKAGAQEAKEESPS